MISIHIIGDFNMAGFEAAAVQSVAAVQLKKQEA